MKISSRIVLLSASFCLLTAVSGWAVFMPPAMSPQLVPVGRLVQSAEAYLVKHPTEADAHYTLARIHYLAFSTKQNRLLAFPARKEDERPSVEEPERRDRDEVSNAKTDAAPTHQDLLDHAARALENFDEALRLDPKSGLYALGRASLLEEFWRWNEAAKPGELPAQLQGISIRRFRDAYAHAFVLAMAVNPKPKNQPIEDDPRIVANEAAAVLIRLAQNNRDTLTEEDQLQLKRAEEVVGRFAKLPRGAITPIVFSLHPAAHLAELLDPRHIVDFDLRGHGAPERWPWVQPELGFLVWDPLETGCIESARQMFGSYTFQIFRRTGYDALAALDDNADGVLSGAELTGLSVWFDGDSDGRSTLAEVTPLRALGVESVAATATSRDGIHPMNPRGLTLRGGRTLPTWDWIVAPVR